MQSVRLVGNPALDGQSEETYMTNSRENLLVNVPITSEIPPTHCEKFDDILLSLNWVWGRGLEHVQVLHCMETTPRSSRERNLCLSDAFRSVLLTCDDVIHHGTGICR